MLGKHLARLSVVGTGLLLGAAIGVIIPEWVRSHLACRMFSN